MIFAEIEYSTDYGTFHQELRDFLNTVFSQVEGGLQGDSWFWILDGGERVDVDTFSAMTHQIKSAKPGPHVQHVIEALSRKYNVKIYDKPVPEAHDLDGEPGV
jgi:hypothetical protein